MSLKQIIGKSLALKKGIKIPKPKYDYWIEIPGDPMIYSIKYRLNTRTVSAQFLRNKGWYSFLKCQFRAFMKTETPLVLIVRFYVKPNEMVSLTARELRDEKVPAIFAFELADYLLSFMEMLLHVLLNSYKQIVKIDMEKYYSSNPRTAIQFMQWKEYVDIQNNPIRDTESKSIRKTRKRKVVQSEPSKDESVEGSCDEKVSRVGLTLAEWATACDRALSHALKKTHERETSECI